MVSRKIEMKLVKSKKARMVTFSKRRNGIFKKANELSILCGVQLCMLVFSPGGKLFAFGHPNIDAVINRFLNPGSESDEGHVGPSKCGGDFKKFKKQHEDAVHELREERNKGETLEIALNRDNLSKGKIPLDGLDLEGLQQLKDSLKITMEAMEVASSLLLLAEKFV